MSDQYTSAVYHVAQPGQLPPGKLISAEDRPGGIVDVYLHPLHVRAEFVWDLNWVTRHLVGYGLWRQRWTDDGRFLEPAKGRGVAVARWEIVPAAAMPKGRTTLCVEEDGSSIWLIREGCCTREMRDAKNELLERLAGDGLWLQVWYDAHELPPPPSTAPRLEPPAVAILV